MIDRLTHKRQLLRRPTPAERRGGSSRNGFKNFQRLTEIVPVEHSNTIAFISSCHCYLGARLSRVVGALSQRARESLGVLLATAEHQRRLPIRVPGKATITIRRTRCL